MTRLVRLVVLVAVWMALWSDLSVANALSGLLIGGVIVGVFDTWRTGRVAVRPVRAVKFAGYFLYKLIESSVIVARAVLAPSRHVRTGIVAVPLKGCSDAVATLIADAISLTPGTLTLDVRGDPLTLYVHALDVRDPEAVRRDIRRLEVLAVEAFGDAAAIAGLAVDDTSMRSQP